MTDDLGPGSMISDDLSAIFAPYVIAAAGLAVERGDDRAAAVLTEAEQADVSFTDAPVTVTGGEAKAMVDVVLTAPPDTLADTDEAVLERLADLFNEVVDADGYRVRRVATDVGAG